MTNITQCVDFLLRNITCRALRTGSYRLASISQVSFNAIIKLKPFMALE